MAEQSYFSIVPSHLLCRKDISANAKLLAALVSSMTKKEGYCYASNQHLADLMGLSPRTIPNLLKELKEVDMISNVVVRNASGEVVQRRLYLAFNPHENSAMTSSLDSVDPPRSIARTSSLDSEVYNKANNKDDNKANNKPPTPLNQIERFDDFWNEWPSHKRKMDKAKCKKKWQSEQLDKIADEIILSVQAWKHSENWNDEGGKFIPMPFTWLHNKRWEEKPKLSEKALQRSNLIQVNYDEIEF